MNVVNVISNMKLFSYAGSKTKFKKYKKSFIDGFYDVYLENGQILYVNPYKDIISFGEIVNKNGFNYTASQRQRWQSELMQEQIKKTSVSKIIKNATNEDL